MNTEPTINPSNTKTIDGLLEEYKKIILKQIEKVIPVEVLEYDRNKNRVKVKSLLYVNLSNKKIEMMPFIDIPVLNIGGGGFFINFPIKQGDKGWLLSCDKDISIFKQNLTLSNTNTNLKHRYDQSFFIPDLINNNVDNDGKLYIGNKQDNINITNDKIEIKSKEIDLTNETTLITGKTNIKEETVIDGKTTINNNLLVNGIINGSSLSISGGGSANVDGPLNANTISARNGSTGTFMSVDNKTITVTNGIITNIV